ncbi:MAG TPA: DUF4331 domain-containing protein [Thermoanaerobaculia bacterium]|jgi:hypothetical protein|nr:DUF4331 domain-containing protein [Thermoanaerobaculia bacterium]
MRKRVVFALALAAAMSLATFPVNASSHREAPGITEMPKVDSTDFYMFRSYESGRGDYVTLIADYYPFQDPFGGPNYFFLDPDARYRIHIDNTGDGVEDITFEFSMAVQLRDLTVPVNGQNVSVPLYNIGPIAETPEGRSPNLNILESYRLAVTRGRVSNNPKGNKGFVTNPTFPNSRFPKPADNVGQKSIPDYNTYSANFVFDFDMPGCDAGDGRVFVGQRKEPFAVNVGEIFDLVNLNPLGARDAEPNALEDKNVTTFAVEVPISCLTRNAASPVIGGWQTSALPNNRGLMSKPTFKEPTNEGGAFVQVSRLGMPLVNEVVIGIKDKNLFNAATPQGDAALAKYITNPTLPEILQLLFPVQAPNNFPRTDLVATFATGLAGVNFLSDGKPHEMQRLNTSIAPTPAGSQNNLGVLGGDNAGFPNGRRPGDDVVDIELRVAMGALCHALPGVFCNPSDAPSGNLPFTDGTLQDVSQFDNTFPYLRDPLPGSPNGPNGVD